MLIRDVTRKLESWAPLSYQESYDNAGLITGQQNWEVKGVLVSLDCTEAVVDDAIKNGCNLIVAHHPIVFSGLKRLNGSNYIERTVIKAIKNDVAIYAIHTNLDHVYSGVNAKIGDLLGIENRKVLQPKSNILLKLVVFCPVKQAESVRAAMFEAGAGSIGKYDSCSYNVNGEGTFKAGEGTNPFVGEQGRLHTEQEIRIETIVSKPDLGKVLSAMTKAHPYEEVAYDVYPLENKHQEVGAGMVGDLPEAIDSMQFLKQVKETFKCGSIRYTNLIKPTIQRVAWCGGAGSFLLENAKRAGADVYITGDFKYHQFFDADNELVIADIGHFESEQFTIELIADFLHQNFSTFAIRLTEVNTNPIGYL